MKIRITIAADHGAWELKQEVIKYLRNKKYVVMDLNPDFDPKDDYPLWQERLQAR